MIRSVVEQGSVREPGQRVVERLFRELLLKELPLGHVEDRAVEPQDGSLGAEDTLTLLVDPADPAVRPDDPILEDVRLSAGDSIAHRLLDALSILRMDVDANVRTLLWMNSDAGYPEMVSMLSLMNSMSQSESSPQRYIAPGMLESSVRKRSSLTRSSASALSGSVGTCSGVMQRLSAHHFRC